MMIPLFTTVVGSFNNLLRKNGTICRVDKDEQSFNGGKSDEKIFIKEIYIGY